MSVVMRERARLLRQQQTQAEQLLWQQLRNRQLAGYRFQRQFVIGFYIVDFVCRAQKLIVELDGVHHAALDQIAYDAERTQFLAAQGFRVLRFWNAQIETSLPNVLQQIQIALQTSS
jgi:very-short-patch-repair endonuclease